MAANKNQIEQLSQFSEIVADTGEIEQIKEYKPVDATTNPSLLFKAAKLDEYKHIVQQAVEWAKQQKGDALENAMDKFAVTLGAEITKVVSGVVSTEIDARLSFDTEKTIAKCYKLLEMYKEVGIDARKRVLFKIASTWEGLQAMKVLEADGIRCNMTLLFDIWQAATAAEFGAFLISPFVGRITDWHKKLNGWTELPNVEEDPGVVSVRNIYNYYKTFDKKTVVMGASFRSKEQVLALAGCHKLTVSPKLLKLMKESTNDVPRILFGAVEDKHLKKLVCNEANFRWGMNENPMATEKLAEGIRNFAKDTVKLENILTENYFN